MADVPRNVNVVAELGEKGSVSFSMTGAGVSGEKIEFDKNTTNGMKKSEHYLVAFTLDDNTGLGLRYVRPKDDAMWVKVVADPDDPTCPAPHLNLPQFKAINCTDTVLTVRNKDEIREYLKFALNFIRSNGNDKNPAEYVQYDPIGDNRNGGVTTRSNPVLLAVIVVVVITAVATKLLRLW